VATDRGAEKWPLAFPTKPHDIRPLAIGAAGEIAAAMGWSLPYVLGILNRWKLTPVYCRAVLLHNERIALDGTPAEAVDVAAKDLATKQRSFLDPTNALIVFTNVAAVFIRYDLDAIFVIIPDAERTAEVFGQWRLAEQAGVFEPGEVGEFAQARQSPQRHGRSQKAILRLRSGRLSSTGQGWRPAHSLFSGTTPEQ
jgi:ProQ/FINO family